MGKNIYYIKSFYFDDYQTLIKTGTLNLTDIDYKNFKYKNIQGRYNDALIYLDWYTSFSKFQEDLKFINKGFHNSKNYQRAKEEEVHTEFIETDFLTAKKAYYNNKKVLVFGNIKNKNQLFYKIILRKELGNIFFEQAIFSIKKIYCEGENNLEFYISNKENINDKNKIFIKDIEFNNKKKNDNKKNNISSYIQVSLPNSFPPKIIIYKKNYKDKSFSFLKKISTKRKIVFWTNNILEAKTFTDNNSLKKYFLQLKNKGFLIKNFNLKSFEKIFLSNITHSSHYKEFRTESPWF